MDGDEITPISDLYAQRGWRAATQEEFDALTAGDLPVDGEG